MSRLMNTHRELLERFRYSMNLVGPGPIEPHFADATKALEPLTPTGLWADLGTGAGFPGIVFADHFPEVELELVDSRKKRCIFLDMILAQAPLEASRRVRVRCARIEQLEEARYDGVLARALAPPVQVLHLAQRILKPGGRVLLMLNHSQEIPDPSNYEQEWIHNYSVEEKKRRSVVFRRINLERVSP